MKRIFIALVIIVLVALAVPFFALGPDGGPLLRPYHLTHPQDAVERIRMRFVAHETVIYKWRDAGGDWMYGAEPPPGVEAEAIAVHSETNVMPAYEQER